MLPRELALTLLLPTLPRLPIGRGDFIRSRIGPAILSLTASYPSSDSASGSCTLSLSGVCGTKGSSRSTCHSRSTGSSSSGRGSPFHNDGMFLFCGTPFTLAKGSSRMTPIIANISGHALTARRGRVFARRLDESPLDCPPRVAELEAPGRGVSKVAWVRVGEVTGSSA